jgi:hypothetical protein
VLAPAATLGALYARPFAAWSERWEYGLANEFSKPSAGGGEPSVRRRQRRQIVAAALLLLLLAVRIALPVLAERVLEGVLSDALEVDFAIGDVDLGVLEGRVACDAVAMRVEGSKEDLARASRVVIDADWGALIAGELRAERIAIEGPDLFVEIDEEGRLNWEVLGGPNGERGTFRVMSELLDVGAGRVRLVDRTQGGLPDLIVAVGALRLEGAVIARETPEDPVRWALGRAEASDWHLGVTPIGREALDFEIHANAGPQGDAGALPLEMSMTRKGGVELAVNGVIQPVPFAFEFEMAWRGLSSRSLAPLVLRGADVERGTAHGALALKLDLADGPKRGFKVTGNVQHDDLVLRVDNDPPIDLEIERFVGEIDEIWFPIPAQAPTTPQPIRVAWKQIELQKPSINVRAGIKSGAAPTPEEPAAVPASDESTTGTERTSVPPPNPLELRIATLALSGGRLIWHDLALGERSEKMFSEIRLDANALHWPPATVQHAKLVIGSLGAKPLRIEGPVGADGAELAIRGSGIKLVPWNPLISQYSPYTIDGGSLSIKSDFTLAADVYEAPTKITLHRIKASAEGSRFKRTFGIPLATAITLLSDASGNIDLAIPVSGRLGAGGELRLAVSLVDAMREGITNALTSVIASPLGVPALLVSRGHDLAFLRIGTAVFEPGVVTLDQAARDELDRAAAFVAKSPDARLGLAAEVAAADLEAPGMSAKKSNVFRSLAVGGAALFGGHRKLDSRTYLLALDLAEARFKAAVDHIAAAGVLAPERVVQHEWNEKIVAGRPQIVLRLDMSRDEDDAR